MGSPLTYPVTTPFLGVNLEAGFTGAALAGALFTALYGAFGG